MSLVAVSNASAVSGLRWSVTSFSPFWTRVGKPISGSGSDRVVLEVL